MTVPHYTQNNWVWSTARAPARAARLHARQRGAAYLVALVIVLRGSSRLRPSASVGADTGGEQWPLKSGQPSARRPVRNAAQPSIAFVLAKRARAKRSRSTKLISF